MKGIARTQKEIEFHDRVAQLGCISCRQEGNYNPWVSIHHAHGRTKPGCHMWVLPLCEPHHQDNGTAIARHPYKRRWEAKYGNEDDLIRAMWTELGVEFTEPVRVAKPVDRDRPKRATSEAVEVGLVKLREIKPKVDKSVKAKIQSGEPFQARADKPMQPAPKTSAPSRPKAKIQSAGFRKGTKPFGNVTAPTKKPKVAQRADRSKIDASEKNNNEISSAYKAKVKSDIEKRKADYIESNKDVIEERKRKQREYRKEIRSKIMSERRR